MDAGQILLKHGLLSDEELQRASRGQQNGTRLDQAAVEMGLLDESDALRAFGAEIGVECIDLPSAEIDKKLLAQFRKS